MQFKLHLRTCIIIYLWYEWTLRHWLWQKAVITGVSYPQQRRIDSDACINALHTGCWICVQKLNIFTSFQNTRNYLQTHCTKTCLFSWECIFHAEFKYGSDNLKFGKYFRKSLEIIPNCCVVCARHQRRGG